MNVTSVHRTGPAAMRRIAVMVAAGALVFTTISPPVNADDGAVGLERAMSAALSGLSKAQKTSFAHGQPDTTDAGHGLTGRERALEAVTKAMDRGNGNGKAYGRGNAAYILEVLSGGDIPGQLDVESHGEAVRDLVRAYNELRAADEGGS